MEWKASIEGDKSLTRETCGRGGAVTWGEKDTSAAACAVTESRQSLFALENPKRGLFVNLCFTVMCSYGKGKK